MADERALTAQADRPARTPAALLEADADDAAFRAQLERSLDRGYRLAAIIVGDRGEAEDLTHDAIERAWRGRKSLRDLERFEAWFHRIIVNACRDRLRRRRSAPITLSVDAAGDGRMHDALRAGSADLSVVSARREALGQALRLLPDDQRIVIVLRFYLDLEIDEIARRLGTRPGTVKSRLHRALARMRAAWAAAEAREGIGR